MRDASTVEILRRLVAFDTTSRNSNLALVDYVAGLLDRPGVALRRVVSEDGTKANLVATFGPAGDERRLGLVLSGHTDTVPAEEPDWTSDPFTLVERDGRLYARGAADMKGFVALALALARRVDPARLHHPLVLVLTYDEELGTLGAQQLVRSWDAGAPPLPRAAVVGEPTELLAVRLHKGHLKLRLEVPGRGAHSAYPHLGDNAIVKAAAVVRELAALGDELAAERYPSSAHFPDTPGPTLNVGTIRGGSAINVVPERCFVEVGIRLLPGMSSPRETERVRDRAERAAPGTRLEMVSDTPPMLCRESSPAYRELVALLGQDETHAVHFASDAGPLQELGLEPVLWGPGSIAVAHKPDESIPLADLARAEAVLEELVRRLCGAAA